MALQPPSQAPPEHHSLFASGKPPAPAGGDPMIQQQLSSLSRRAKMLEETVENLRRKEQLDEHNTIEQNKEQNVQLKTFAEELDEMKASINQIRKDVSLIIKELQQTAKQEEFQVLQKYIKMWQPVKFVTAKEVQRIVQDELRQHLQ